MTNIVKHFKWKRTAAGTGTPSKRRLHDKPNGYEVAACKPWLDAEIARIGPKIVVCLGSTAAQGLLGKDFRVTRQRGEFIASDTGVLLTATVHPSSILRAADAAARDREMGAFVRDLERIAERLEGLA